MVLVRTQFIFLGRRQDARHTKGLRYRWNSGPPYGVCTGHGWFADQPVQQNGLYGCAHARLNDPTARFHDLGADYHTTRINTERRTRNYVTQLIAMGYRVTPESAA
jgi:hypothetical protein